MRQRILARLQLRADSSTSFQLVYGGTSFQTCVRGQSWKLVLLTKARQNPLAYPVRPHEITDMALQRLAEECLKGNEGSP